MGVPPADFDGSSEAAKQLIIPQNVLFQVPVGAA
jgi:hypothetical protein